MKTKILDINGKEKKDIELPKCFSAKVRGDIVAKVLEVEKVQQPYSPSLVAGKQHSASGKIKRHRHVWKSGYGRGRSRVPRKQMSRRGTQFNWVGAEVSNTRGGRRAHPPKVLSRMGLLKINKKERILALKSALSATANKEFLIKKYARLEEGRMTHLPLIVEDKIIKLKTKDLIASLKKVLGEKLFDVAMKKKTVRAGRGKMRGRKYKSNAGALLVIGKDEDIKTKTIEFQNADKISVSDLAKGGVGRLVVYTEKAMEYLGGKLK